MSLISLFTGIQSGIRQKSIIHIVCVFLAAWSSQTQATASKGNTALPFDHFHTEILAVKQHMLTGAQKVAVNIHRQRRQLDTPEWKACRLGVPQGVYPGWKRSPLFELRTGAFNKEPCIITALWEMRENIKVQEFTMWPFESTADQMPEQRVQLEKPFIE